MDCNCCYSVLHLKFEITFTWVKCQSLYQNLAWLRILWHCHNLHPRYPPYSCRKGSCLRCLLYSFLRRSCRWYPLYSYLKGSLTSVSFLRGFPPLHPEKGFNSKYFAENASVFHWWARHTLRIYLWFWHSCHFNISFDAFQSPESWMKTPKI